jgi:hypothetical protein
VDPEETVSRLIVALGESRQLLARKLLDLHRLSEWSDITAELAPSGNGFAGYVDGELAGVGGVAWSLDLVREGRGWIVERSLNLNRNTTDFQETVTALPHMRYDSSPDLAEHLINLVRELLALPPPNASTPTG